MYVFSEYIPHFTGSFDPDADGKENFQILYDISEMEISTIPQNSGALQLQVLSNPKFPILIHEDDIGIQNTIGPFTKEDGSKVTIKLSII